MRVVALIPCWNARARLAATLAALDGQVAAIVVVDNASTDGGPEWLAARRPDVRLLCNPANLGYPAAVNRGVTEAARLGAEGVLLVNDDAVFQPGAVEALSSVLASDARAAAVSAKMRYSDRPRVLNGTGGLWVPSRGWAALRGAGETDRGQYDLLLEADYPSGAASLLRAAALRDLGGMDEAYFLYFEDAEWGLRAARAGWRTRYCPQALVLHVGSAGTAGQPERRRYYNVRNRLLLASRYAPLHGRLRAVLETLALAARQGPRWAFPQRRRDAEAVLLGALDHLRGRYGRSDRFG